jgi:hypothetical protein
VDSSREAPGQSFEEGLTSREEVDSSKSAKDVVEASGANEQGSSILSSTRSQSYMLGRIE